ncbi:PAS domain S-box protein [Sphingobium fuliginis]|uniref:PAS domain S-box protein n=1 Tax=Sphingobium fuliginis (strain ATCC 27551) TaxID=336203 RepID=UPI001ABFDCF3|nr:PAS domain-containing protein [Sphingobium fuliginis]
MKKPEPSRAISADEWRQIVDGAVGTAIVTTDLEGRVTSWNEGASRMLGWTASEVLGETLERLFPPERAPRRSDKR